MQVDALYGPGLLKVNKVKLVKSPCVSSSLSHTQLFKFPAPLCVFSAQQGNKELVNDQLII